VSETSSTALCCSYVCPPPGPYLIVCRRGLCTATGGSLPLDAIAGACWTYNQPRHSSVHLLAKKKIAINHLRELIPFLGALSRRELNPITLAYCPSRSDGWLSLLTASTFNLLSQYTSSPGNRTYCYAELAVTSLAMAVTTASTHFAYLRRDGHWPC